MKLLISSLNESKNLLTGFDTDTQEIFWELPRPFGDVTVLPFTPCGISYVRGHLVAAGFSHLWCWGKDSWDTSLGHHKAMAHSVGSVGDRLVVVDSGKSCLQVRKWGGDFEGTMPALDAIELHHQQVHDAYHLNDFCETPHGLLASCFTAKPKRDDSPWRNRQERMSGLILSMDEDSRVVYCGLDCPHSLTYLEAEPGEAGVLLVLANDHLVQLTWDEHVQHYQAMASQHVSATHFVRGMVANRNEILMGGSVTRKDSESLAAMQNEATLGPVIYRIRLGEVEGDAASSQVEEMLLWEGPGEIYDLLPWDDEIMWEASRALEQAGHISSPSFTEMESRL
tara:strand:+ start:7631 stop:8647 length:1017 start_codon:yes stop_codon:yes gene_type:complete